jgi:hypothetical protein
MNIEDVLKTIPDKTEWQTTTSHKFKLDVFHFFKEMGKGRSCLELGTHKGQTTKVLSLIFDEVFTINHGDHSAAMEFNADRTNINFLKHDLYSEKWWENVPRADVIFIDALHETKAVLMDVENSLKIYSPDKKYFIFDDYGLIQSVRMAINKLLFGPLSKVCTIGEPKGHKFTENHLLLDSEGLICIEN